MMNHYKGKEKSKWKWGATKEHFGLPLDQFESQAMKEEGEEKENCLIQRLGFQPHLLKMH